MSKSGIYEIRSICKPWVVYIGSSIDLKAREKRHFSDLKKNMHCNQYLQRHSMKYGFDDLQFKIIAHCSVDDLLEMEQNYIDWLKPKFNMLPAAGSRYGYKATNATIEKLKTAWKTRSPISMFSRLFKKRSV